jgi:hypothetical protein
MVRYVLSAVLLLAFGGWNTLEAEEQTVPSEKTVVGLGEVCNPKIGPSCKSGLQCNSAEPDKAGVCANAVVPEKVLPKTPTPSNAQQDLP